MSELIDGATGSTIPVAELLRRCVVLGHRTGATELSTWAERELNGYVGGAELPDYRVLTGVTARGNFVGPFQSASNGMPLHESAIDDQARDALFTAPIRQSAEELEALAASQGPLRSPWPQDVVVYYADAFFEGISLVQAWRDISPATLKGVLGVIRNRILVFALELESVAPEAGNSGADQPPASQVTQIFHTTIYGDSNTVAVSGHDTVQHVTIASFADLRRELEALGLPEEELAALEVAVRDDGPTSGEMGAATASWSERVRAKIAEGAIQLTTGATAQAVVALVLAFLGSSPAH